MKDWIHLTSQNEVIPLSHIGHKFDSGEWGIGYDTTNLKELKNHSKNITTIFQLQCPPLYRITFSRHESDNNNPMIQLTDVFYVYCLHVMESAILDYNKRLILLSIKRRALYLLWWASLLLCYHKFPLLIVRVRSQKYLNVNNKTI